MAQSPVQSPRSSGKLMMARSQPLITEESAVGTVLKHRMPVAMMIPQCALAAHRVQTILNCGLVNQERLRVFFESLGRSDDYANMYCAVNGVAEEMDCSQCLSTIRSELHRQLLAISLMPAVGQDVKASKSSSGVDCEEEYVRLLFVQLADEIVRQCSEFKMVEDGMASELINRESMVFTLTQNANSKDVKDDLDFENALKCNHNTLKEMLMMSNRDLVLPSPPQFREEENNKLPSMSGWPLDLTQVKLNNDITLEDYMLGMHGCVLSASMNEEELNALLAVTKNALDRANAMEKELHSFRDVMQWAEQEFRDMLTLCGETLDIANKRDVIEDAANSFDQLAKPVCEVLIKLANDLYRYKKFCHNCDAEQKSLDEYVTIINDEGDLRIADAARRADIIQTEHRILKTAVEDKRQDIERLSAIECQLQDAIREGMVTENVKSADKVDVSRETKIARVQRKLEELNEIKRKMDDQKTNLEAELQKRQQELAEVERQGEEAIGDLQRQVDEKKAAIDELAKRANELQSRNEELTKKLENLDQNRVFKETALRQLQVRHDLQSRLKDKRKAEALERRQLLQQKQQSLENEVSAYRNQISKLQEEKNKELDSEKELNERIAKLQDDLDRSKSQESSIDQPSVLPIMTSGDQKTLRALEEIVKNCTSKDDAAIRLGLEISRYSRQNEFFVVEIERNERLLAKLLKKIEQLSQKCDEIGKVPPP